jgi:hypothetical protein
MDKDINFIINLNNYLVINQLKKGDPKNNYLIHKYLSKKISNLSDKKNSNKIYKNFLNNFLIILSSLSFR